MDFISNLLTNAFEQTALSVLHNWPYLLFGILVSALLKVVVNPEKVSAYLTRFRGLGVAAATGLAVGTPFCSCGTAAVIIGMMASSMPWAPIVAFMVASPLTSPEELLYSAGIFGWPFALAFFTSSILLGLAGGAIAGVLESKGWLAGQARLASTPASKSASQAAPAASCACPAAEIIPLSVLQPVSAQSCCMTAPAAAPQAIPLSVLQPAPVAVCCDALPGPAAVLSPAAFPPAAELPARLARAGAQVKRIALAMYESCRQLLPMFLGFAFIGYLVNSLIPASWVAGIFGSGHVYSVPLAATLGLPLYINTEGSLPLIRAFINNGMSQGAALAFLIAGAGTSIGAIAGALTIARWRVVGLVIGVLWAGAILAGYTYDLLLALKVF